MSEAIEEVDEGGANTIVVFPGANARCSPRDVEAAAGAIRHAQAIVVQLEIPLDAAEQALRIARRHSIVTALNPAPVQAIRQEILSEVDVLIPNELAAGERLLGMGPKRVVTTLGDKGAVFVGREGRLHVPAFQAPAESKVPLKRRQSLVAMASVGHRLVTADPTQFIRILKNNGPRVPDTRFALIDEAIKLPSVISVVLA